MPCATVLAISLSLATSSSRQPSRSSLSSATQRAAVQATRADLFSIILDVLAEPTC